MKNHKYICDVRVGCVAVYLGPQMNCLDSPERFVYFVVGTRNPRSGWNLDERYIDIAGQIAMRLNSNNVFDRFYGRLMAFFYMNVFSQSN